MLVGRTVDGFACHKNYIKDEILDGILGSITNVEVFC